MPPFLRRGRVTNNNEANMKDKEAGFQARFPQINSKAFYAPWANHSLIFVAVDSAKSSADALLFFGVLTQLYVLFSSLTHRWNIPKKNVLLSLKSQSVSR